MHTLDPESAEFSQHVLPCLVMNTYNVLRGARVGNGIQLTFRDISAGRPEDTYVSPNSAVVMMLIDDSTSRDLIVIVFL